MQAKAQPHCADAQERRAGNEPSSFDESLAVHASEVDARDRRDDPARHGARTSVARFGSFRRASTALHQAMKRSP